MNGIDDFISLKINFLKEKVADIWRLAASVDRAVRKASFDKHLRQQEARHSRSRKSGNKQIEIVPDTN